MESGSEEERAQALAALQWLIAAGADEAIGETSLDRYSVSAPARPERRSLPESLPPRPEGGPPGPTDALPTWTPVATPPAASEAVIGDARAAAAGAADLEALHEAIRGFEGCALKRSATKTVIFRGNPKAEVMLIGEAPGRDEDLQGEPFVGAAGRLLDSMLGWAGFAADEVFITNVLFWRPPGNRSPEQREIAVCLPFVERQIELLRPRYLLLIGNVSTKALLARTEGITRLRGRWFPYRHEGLSAPIPAMAALHPAYLLRQPAQKRQAWRDMLAFRAACAAGAHPLKDDQGGR